MGIGLFGEVLEALMDTMGNMKVGKAYVGRYKDILIGIVLNLACNVRDPSLQVLMFSSPLLIPLLLKILIDLRQDWTTNGAAIALLHLSHASILDTEMFFLLDETNAESLIERYAGECLINETRQHLL